MTNWHTELRKHRCPPHYVCIQKGGRKQEKEAKFGVEYASGWTIPLLPLCF